MNRLFRLFLTLLCLALCLSPRQLRSQGVILSLEAGAGARWPVISGTGSSNRVHVLQSSRDLLQWEEAARFHEEMFSFSDVAGGVGGLPGQGRYFRVETRARTAADDWKNQIVPPWDPFANEPPNEFEFSPSVRWIKFALLLPDPTRVHFQDSTRYKFHYDFASVRLPAFKGMTRAQFDAVTLSTTGQRAVLGAVLLPGAPGVAEYGIQFAGNDVYPRESVSQWFELVKAAVRPSLTGSRAFYVPAFEQASLARDQSEWFRSQGIEVASANRWQAGDVCYSEGWAMGRLIFVPAAEIATAYLTGRLRPTDVLLTDGVPAEVPFVSGVVSLVPATPNSHVVLLARSFNIPMVYPGDASERARIRNLDGRDIVLRVGGGYQCDLKALDIHEGLPEDVVTYLRDLKKPPQLNYAPKALLGGFWTNVVTLKPQDTRYFGGKAANFGLLRRQIPANSPDPVIAFSFDLWEAFLDQTLGSGKTLRAEIDSRLEGQVFPPDMFELSKRLNGVRDLIRGEARWSPALQTMIFKALADAGFDPLRKVRFRSSTNVEDSERFTGAGLYDSFSGCAADDLDADANGPSLCDAGENAERGVLRALQRVYASFYNDNAVLERLRFRIEPATVGMAVLVHYSFPDSEEMANGVATLTMRGDASSKSYEMNLVTQLGAVSVTNPDGSALPEEVDGYLFKPFGGDSAVAFRKGSSLVPLGQQVMTWESDYKNLFSLLVKVADAYWLQSPGRTELLLDFEFKKVRPGRLEVKQVRPLPLPDRDAVETTVLIREPLEFEVFQGEFGDIFSNHRLKSFWKLRTQDLRLEKQALNANLYSSNSVTFLRDESTGALDGSMEDWDGYTHSTAFDTTKDSWRDTVGELERRWTLLTGVIREVNPPRSPIVTLDDFDLSLSVTYSKPQLAFGFQGEEQVLTDTVRLARKGSLVAASEPRQFLGSKGKYTVDVSLYWPVPPKGAVAGYTAPLAAWDRTILTGWTTEPLTLRNVWSQTYHPFHHNFANEFLFEPGLDEGVTPAQRAELRAANVRWIYAFFEGFEPQLKVIGWDGKVRTVN